jgi:L-aminopeptidase/D-esterase-like protein
MPTCVGFSEEVQRITAMNRAVVRLLVACLLTSCLVPSVFAQTKPRARDLGIPFEGKPGSFNAITDVKGVEVGYTTLITGEGKRQVGVGPVRTGVTAIWPRGKDSASPAFAGWFTLNGNGEMTGTTWVEESGLLGGPITITNTHSVGVVRDAVIAYQVKRFHLDTWSLPVVAETYDGWLNDVNGFHVKEKHVFEALENAHGGALAEGNVGGGTGMICHGFKGGTGTSSRVTKDSYLVGVLVQANHGARRRLTVAGVPVGAELGERRAGLEVPPEIRGSIIIVVATDAPLLPHQLKALAKRAALGVGRVGGLGETSSGDIFIAFSTGNAGLETQRGKTAQLSAVAAPAALNDLYAATVQATEEAIINALVAAETMTGADGHKVEALPHDQLKEILKKHARLEERR